MPSHDSPNAESPFVAPSLAPESQKPARIASLLFKAIIITGACFGLFIVGLFILLAPMRRQGKESAERTQCMTHLKSISIAILQYAEIHNRFPPAFTSDSSGKPLHSWRTLILPYLDQQELYRQIDLSKPWDDPVNAAAMNRIPEVYQCSTAKLERDKTTYLAIVGADTVIRGDGSLRSLDLKDNPGETLLIVEAPRNKTISWMSPLDLDESDLQSISDLQGPHLGVVQVAFADGTVRPLSTNMDAKTLRGLITTSGGEELSSNDF